MHIYYCKGVRAANDKKNYKLLIGTNGFHNKKHLEKDERITNSLIFLKKVKCFPLYVNFM